MTADAAVTPAKVELQIKKNDAKRVWAMQRGELCTLMPAFVAAAINGFMFPVRTTRSSSSRGPVISWRLMSCRYELS